MLRLPPQHKAHARSCSHSNAICHHSFKKRIDLCTQEQPLVPKHIGGTIRDRNDRSRTRRTHELPFIAGCSHFTRKNTRFRAPASSPTQSPCNIMQQFQCDLAPQLQETHRTTHTGTTTRWYLSSPAGHFTRKNTRFRAPASSPTHHLPSSPLPFLTTSHRHHLASSPLPFLTTSHCHHVPSSPPPFVHFPSPPRPFLTTSHRPHLPSSPLPFIITSLCHHFPSSPLPFVTTSLRHHFSSSPPRHYHHPSSRSIPPLLFLLLCIVVFGIVLWYHPSSRSIPPLLILLLCIVMLCIVMWSTTLHQSQFHRFLFFCYVLLCYVLLCDLPPFIISSLRILFVRNTEVLLPNFLWLNQY